MIFLSVALASCTKETIQRNPSAEKVIAANAAPSVSSSASTATSSTTPAGGCHHENGSSTGAYPGH
ncbi:MAG: hypothetical protein JWM28_1018 [Chitinophagaceae bacterium]|nr:hypothetical protein [Chitinophagaceae bacterium]